MRAIGYYHAAPISTPNALVEFEAATPVLGPRDLLIQVCGVAVNPVDIKVRTAIEPEKGTAKIFGYDAAGVVREVGGEVSRFSVGDEVFYAGDILRQGCNAELQAVDERVVGKKPKALSFPEAAGLPLTSITAWEILFDCFALRPGDGDGYSLLITAGAGGVGSIMIQLAKKLTNLTVVATASRPESTEWVMRMGADHVVDHTNSLLRQVKALDLQPRYVASQAGIKRHYSDIIELMRPRGHITIIDDPESIDLLAMRPKALSLSWQSMFARTMFQLDDIDKQHEVLDKVSELIDEGSLISTVTDNLGKISVETLQLAHERQMGGRVIGKNVLEGF